ncbi:attachment p12 family protein [Fontibacillus phaseoli]|uniref:Attachment p12 family protein n=1 Tax=Fontibacillus phaseoli TaxID=1416533 RepID=A0A369ATT5_9BACL|nr:FeoB-associated Cys-rich membrane protein [Fontibacillus phaseoli]RCX12495.1 attachment p12 family protein [Fontibacillus phaseoli]
MADIVIITIVFSYAAFALYRGLRKSKKGACASCSQQKSCSAACSDSPVAASSKSE